MWKLQCSLEAAQRIAALPTTASPSSHITDAVTSSPAPSGSIGLSPSPAPSPTTEGSAMCGDRTASLAASNPHTPDRDSNPVPPLVPSPPTSHIKHCTPMRQLRVAPTTRQMMCVAYLPLSHHLMPRMLTYCRNWQRRFNVGQYSNHWGSEQADR